jgi:cold-inducible RNA-binding protein
MEFVGKQNQKIFSWQIPKEETMKNNYVGNLPHSTTETQLRTLFEAHGKVQRVNIITDKETGRAKGFAFVEMAEPGEADKACLALSGTELQGRALRVNEAKSSSH